MTRAIAILGDRCLPPFHTDNYWINFTWSEPVTLHLVMQHILFLGNYDWSQFNTAFWSLVYEMRISLVFPLIALAVLRLRSLWLIFIAAALSAACFPLVDLFSGVWASARNRWPWLALNLCTAFFASRVIGGFESTIEKVVALAALTVLEGEGK